MPNTKPQDIAVIDAQMDYCDALISRDLAGQVTAIRAMHKAGADIAELAAVTNCSPEFLLSLVA